MGDIYAQAGHNRKVSERMVGPIPVVTKLRRHPHLVLAYAPGSGKGHVINPLAIPRCATRRLVSVAPPPRRPQNSHNYYESLESGMMGNNYHPNRIVLVRYRPTPPPVPQSKVLYIEDVTDSNHYGKETRLMRRELSPAFGYGSPWDTASSAMVPFSRPLFSLHNIPLRSASEVKEIADMRRLYVRARNPDVGYSPINKALLYRMPMPVYVDPTLPQSYYIELQKIELEFEAHVQKKNRI
ncbi:hypothetical protein Ocin01_06790 [Orchesella cincta]|uniref:Uncharacterized protein n=1 Tax=Orchesella cincta TaxID=48709 RepID=A0A1D2N3U5_ORCCI|nr:hypothetical protein Ocin01_06790 [Orchesella cincta]